MRCLGQIIVNRGMQADCIREMVSHILKDLENGGYIHVEQRRIVLVKKLPARWRMQFSLYFESLSFKIQR